MIHARRLLVLAVTAVVAVASYLAWAAPASAATAGGGYVAVTPTRLLDTRVGTGAAKAAVRADSSIVLQVDGRATVPASGVSAVVLNVTVTAPTSGGYITAYANGSTRPTASNLNFTAGLTRPNLAVVPVGTGGKVVLYNGSAGTVQLVADVSGYYVSGTPFAQGGFGALATPTRRLDTRIGTGAAKRAVAAHGSVAFTVTGSGVPSQASAVVVNVTATAPTAAGPVTAYADGGTRPGASNLNFVRGQTVANLAVVPVGSDGKVALYNGSAGTVQLVADVSGYFTAGDPVLSGGLGALAPARLLDTRSGVGAAKAAVHANSSIALTVAGRGGVPLSSVSAVVLNVTPVAPTANGPVTVYADGAPKPGVSNLNLLRAQITPNLVLAPVGSDGKVRLYNGSAGTVQLVADVSGYVLKAPAPLPSTSTSRYVRNITGVAGDATTMHTEGCTDAQDGSSYVVLDIGAQSNTNSPASANGVVLSATNPGVRLTELDPPVRLTYPQLDAAVEGYLDGYDSCATTTTTTTTATVALGTSNDGDFTVYAAAIKAADWAAQVTTLRAYVSTKGYAHLSVVGASDIEPNFASTEAQAETWVTTYLKDTTADLVDNGSAGDCPSTYGATGDCGAVAGQTGPNWTRADFVRLTYGLGPGRIQVLPQVYFPYQAVQWANIDVTSGRHLTFAGSLTENAADSPGSQPAPNGWAALWHALSTVVAAPTLPAATDLQIDS